MLIHCVKCRTKTETNNEHMVTTKNNRPMIKGTCVICGRKRASFVKRSSAKPEKPNFMGKWI